MSVLQVSPFKGDELKQLEELLSGLNREKAWWLHGYLNGYLRDENIFAPGVDESIAKSHLQKSISVVYGTHTGNSKRIADSLKERAAVEGINILPVDMDNYKVRKLKDEQLVFFIVSTHGEGDPPLGAEQFYSDLHGKKAPKINQTKYAVLALGDKSYLHYCKTGADIDKRLEELGGKRLLDRTDCDVDYSETADKWIEDVLEKIQSSQPRVDSGNKVSLTNRNDAAVRGTRKYPAKAELLERVNLNGRSSDKNTYHIELGIEEQGITYTPGDALGMWPVNDPLLVQHIIKKTGLNPDRPVQWKDSTLPLSMALREKFEIASLNLDTLKKYEALTGNKKLTNLLGDHEKVRAYLYGHDILDLLNDFNHALTAEELIACLRNLQPRLYSIASSQKMVDQEIHLTIGKVFYKNRNRYRNGACSSYVCDVFSDDHRLDVFIDSNDNFRLPADPEKPIIMIGPGTGVAPFRAFLQEREVTGAKGKNWLFFGDRKFTTDFLYQVEWQKWHQQGLLNHISLAFSRDQKEKRYVQHKILESQKEFFSWIQDGALIYVCGDKNHMAKDVLATIETVVSKQGNLSEEKAKEFVKKLKREKRYLEDVY